MNYRFQVADLKKIRLIIDTDAKNEADDQFAIVHALLTPKFELEGIIATHFGNDRTDHSMEESYAEVIKILKLSGFYGQVPALRGAEKALVKKERASYFGNFLPAENEGVRFIIDQAKKADPRPLYLGVLGPLTNVASALLLEPAIARKLVIVWNGGESYPHGGKEFNLMNDIAAANIVFSSSAEVWQIPADVYCKPKVGLAELQYKVAPCGEIGEYLFTQLVEFINEMASPAKWPPAESLDICDLAVTGVLLDEHEDYYEWREAPFITEDMHYIFEGKNRPIRVYKDFDQRFIMEDFFAKLALNYRK